MRSVRCECGNSFIRKTSGDKFRKKCRRCLYEQEQRESIQRDLDSRPNAQIELEVKRIARNWKRITGERYEKLMQPK